MTEPTKTEEVHFYPGSKIMVYLVDGRIAAMAGAKGGPPTRLARDPGESMAAGPTTAGVFTFDRSVAYHTKTWSWSKIPWGTRIRVSRTNSGSFEYLSHLGKWRPSTIMVDVRVTLPNGKKRTKKRLLNVNDVIRAYKRLRGADEFPDRWVFNDFGPTAIRYYRDKNRNGKRNADEPLSGEMIHTTDKNEAESDLFKETLDDEGLSDRFDGQFAAVHLSLSHGCIHIRPADRDRFTKIGAFRKGMRFVVHPYGEYLDPDKYR
jgi:hypothetical protein